MERVIRAISQYRSRQIDFQELRGWLVPGAKALESKLGYERRDFGNDLDNWFEFIEFAFRVEDRRELTLSLVKFIEHLIKTEPKPIVLPREDKVVKEHLMKCSS